MNWGDKHRYFLTATLVLCLCAAVFVSPYARAQDAASKQTLTASMQQSESWTAFQRAHGLGIRMAANAACTQACQRTHDRCYADCSARYAESEAVHDCFGACDGDKRACRKSCR